MSGIDSARPQPRCGWNVIHGEPQGCPRSSDQPWALGLNAVGVGNADTRPEAGPDERPRMRLGTRLGKRVPNPNGILAASPGVGRGTRPTLGHRPTPVPTATRLWHPFLLRIGDREVRPATTALRLELHQRGTPGLSSFLGPTLGFEPQRRWRWEQGSAVEHTAGHAVGDVVGHAVGHTCPESQRDSGRQPRVGRGTRPTLGHRPTPVPTATRLWHPFLLRIGDREVRPATTALRLERHSWGIPGLSSFLGPTLGFGPQRRWRWEQGSAVEHTAGHAVGDVVGHAVGDVVGHAVGDVVGHAVGQTRPESQRDSGRQPRVGRGTRPTLGHRPHPASTATRLWLLPTSNLNLQTSNSLPPIPRSARGAPPRRRGR